MAVNWDGLPVAPDEPHGCTVVVRRTDDRFLVPHRAVNGADYEGDWAWTPPAGARLPGERVCVAAARELYERRASSWTSGRSTSRVAGCLRW